MKLLKIFIIEVIIYIFPTIYSFKNKQDDPSVGAAAPPVESVASSAPQISYPSNPAFQAQFQKFKRFRCNAWTGQLGTNDKQVILNAHNWYRNEVACGKTTIGPKLPFASDMLQMYWSDAIATKAQLWANNCKFQHSTKEYRRQTDFPTGENIYESSSNGTYAPMNWNDAITAWYNEIVGMQGKNIESLSVDGTVTGHFSQVVWSKSYMVGCGFAQYQNGGSFTNLYICEYGPVGNVVGMPIYATSGAAACVCPKGTSCGNETYPSLCCPDGACKWQDQLYNGLIIPGTIPQSLQQ